jgi:arabinose-5-phosphate isomerase
MLEQARTFLRAEARVVAAVAEQLDEAFVQLVRLFARFTGRIFVTGAGPSGAMADRLALLLGTCGMPAFFIPGGDALHGESALATPGDILITLCKAGKSADLNQYAGMAGRRGCTAIARTADPDTELASLSHLVIVTESGALGEEEGVLPFGSTLADGALGALCLMAKRMRGFDLRQLPQTHPLGGASELVGGTTDMRNEDGR